jgi:DNA-binding PadR family transcriptional regulator
LMRRKPALMVQIAKTGSSRQARKVYKVTHAGREQVARMLAGVQDNED